jgi:hypothetical protein
MTVDVYRCQECGETVPTPVMAWDHVLRNGHAPVMEPYRERVDG